LYRNLQSQQIQQAAVVDYQGRILAAEQETVKQKAAVAAQETLVKTLQNRVSTLNTVNEVQLRQLQELKETLISSLPLAAPTMMTAAADDTTTAASHPMDPTGELRTLRQERDRLAKALAELSVTSDALKAAQPGEVKPDLALVKSDPRMHDLALRVTQLQNSLAFLQRTHDSVCLQLQEERDYVQKVTSQQAEFVETAHAYQKENERLKRVSADYMALVSTAERDHKAAVQKMQDFQKEELARSRLKQKELEKQLQNERLENKELADLVRESTSQLDVVAVEASRLRTLVAAEVSHLFSSSTPLFNSR